MVVRIGVLGIAHPHGYSYITQLQKFPDVKVVGIFDHDSLRARKAAEKFKIDYFKKLDPLLQSCDAVIVTSENSWHREYTEIAAKEKLDVLCEKPIATSVEDAVAMLKTAKENNIIFQIAFPVRFAPVVQEAKKVIQSGELGEILSVTSTNHGRMPGGWFVDPKLSGGGAIMDHTVHVVDIIRWLLDTEVSEVSAAYYDTLIYDLPVEDCGLMMLKLSNGAFMTLDCSWSRPSSYPYWGNVTVRLVGTKGTLFFSAFDARIRLYSNELGVMWKNFGDNFDQELIKNFIENIIKRKEPFTSGKDGLEALRVAIAAYESGKERHSVPIIHEGRR